MALKILHVSDGPLPDWRVEKSAISSKNKENQVYFAGLKPSAGYSRNIFTKIFELNWNPKARYKFPYEWYVLKKQMMNVIKDVRPDIIHAHNVFSAKLIQEVGEYPYIYDNHEYWSKFLIYQYESNYDKSSFDIKLNKLKPTITKFVNDIKKNKRKMWIKWEIDVVSDVPTIVPSNSIAIELASIGKKIFTLPNFPMKSEIEFIKIPQDSTNFSSVYAGTAPYQGYQTPIKNVDGFINLFEKHDIGILNILGWKSDDSKNVVYHGFLDRKEMISEMLKSSIGIIPWKKHPFHYYCNPNKAYEYAHAGLLVFSTYSLKPIFDELKDNVIGFEDYDEMIDKLKYYKSETDELYSKRLKIYEFARNNLLWENYENNISDAYNLV